ncbi:hypothetical protein PVIIG_06054 [Plasmodium vivax India VII]|uniref:Variable surface protein n=1 Tax=Plasmodium vivax India VII TaxID=1077284 RepID=A0A0J9SHE2_PLAVI|nr:hypothetical protein PVIIG_06054 [Plasmodium vivax India VII]
MEGYMYKFKTVFTDIESIYEGRFENGLEMYQEKCKTFIADNSIIEDDFNTNCKKCMNYLDYIDKKNYRQNEKTAQAMLYLYCWLYDNELYKEKYSNKLNIYMNFINKYDDQFSNLPQIFSDHVKKNFNDNLKKVYDLYYKFDKFKYSKDNSNRCEIAKECVNSYTSYNNNCSAVDNSDFCAGVKEFEEYFVSYMKDNNCCPGIIKYSIFFKSRIILAIMITIIITLITTFIIFFRYRVIKNFKLMYERYKYYCNIHNIKIL